MNTSGIIESLVSRASAAGPVRRLPAVHWRLAAWTLFSTAVILAALILFDGIRPDLSAALSEPQFLAETALVVAFAILAAYSALSLSVPGNEMRRWLRVAPLLALAAMAGVSLAQSVPRVTDGIDLSWGGVCSVLIIGVGLLPGLFIFRQASRAAPLRRGWVGALAAMASTGAICAGLQFVCHGKPALHFVIWHVSPVLGCTLVGIAIGQRLLRWWGPSRAS